MAFGVTAAFFALLVALSILGDVPLQLLAAYVLLSVISFAMYGLDKAAAGKGRRRISEATLLFAGLIGGWPGALVAQQAFRHKTRKQPFQAIFWCGVVVNCAVLGWLIYTGEAARLWDDSGFG
ncbi:DUF1294 domain-containing protein [Halomonas sp. BC04]|uniref:DUF1294 domain-containing protein n=1 Tax=Halomonas sp. BC04 TaxID=1403540 RepID=UPI0003ED7A4B|nr:DUF1294 domain-containing protein [Halomonas sp. BC04]EWG97879.1 DNA-binding protein [Halomonas sp. BC04]